MTSLTNRQFLTVLALRDGTERAAVQIESEAGAVRDARRFVREQLKGWGLEADGFIDRVVLATSELVTNAVVHARTRPMGESEHVEIALAFRPGIALGVLVTDNSGKVPLLTIRPSVNATSGRGLNLVSAMADGWAAARRASREGISGKGVWAFFGCPEPAGQLPHSA